MSKTPVIAVENLTKYFGRITGVKALNFSVNRGEVFAFLGPNGAGKTTTIRLLLDLLRPTDGRIFYQGQPVAANNLAIRKNCGYLPGEFKAYSYLTAGEFLDFSARVRRVSPISKIKLIDRFGFTGEYLNRKIKHLSKGNLQKLGIIQAFFHNPQLLVLDEPTAGLDPLMQDVFYETVRDFQKNGSTIFLSSHNLSEVEKICHRVAIIRKGELVTLEKLDDLKKKRYRKLKLTLAAPVENFKIPDATLLMKNGFNCEFLVRTEVKTLLAALNKLPLVEFTYSEPELEEIFMTYYRNAENE